MNISSTISRRWWLVAALVSLWAVLLTQSCDRNAERANANGEAASADPADEDAPDEQAGEQAGDQPATDEETSLPGEAEPGTIQPETLGPEAPGVFFLAGLKGYLEPCGCSAEVLLGGIDRIVGYVEEARELYPDTAMVDGGDMLFEFETLEDHAIPQEKAKTDVIVAAQKALGTQVTVPGELDFALGTEFYNETIAQTGAQPIAANLTIAGESLPASHVIELDDVELGVVGAVNPPLYESVDGVQATEAAPAVERAVSELNERGVDTVLLLMHGDLPATRQLLEAVDGVDFAVIGHGPRETDQVYEVDQAHTFEAFDQGRYLGVLKLFERQEDAPYANAGAASETEIEKIERLIAHKQDQIDRFPPSKRRENPPILERLRADIEKFEDELRQLKSGTVDVPEEGNAFIYRPVPMEPGLPISEELNERRTAFNEQLQELQMDIEREVPPVEEGEAFFVGNPECARCHVEEQQFWEETRHAQAVETLEERDKLFDQSCIGCHVVGYEKPGGSVIGKLHYEAQVGERTIEKNLEDVGCENCHGPGSEHVQSPVDSAGNPQHITVDPGEDACAECHVPEHSPKFNFDTYVEDITGEGHAMDSQ